MYTHTRTHTHTYIHTYIHTIYMFHRRTGNATRRCSLPRAATPKLTSLPDGCASSGICTSQARCAHTAQPGTHTEKSLFFKKRSIFLKKEAFFWRQIGLLVVFFQKTVFKKEWLIITDLLSVTVLLRSGIPLKTSTGSSYRNFEKV